MCKINFLAHIIAITTTNNNPHSLENRKIQQCKIKYNSVERREF